MTEYKTGKYKPLSQERRESVAASCERGHNNSRVLIARQIRSGDLFDADGYPKGYWHCLATEPPQDPEGRRGQWKAAAEQPSEWYWQDWGPDHRWDIW